MDADRILESCRHPYHEGSYAARTHEQHICYARCGDEVTLYLYIRESLLHEAWFVSSGCMVSRAATSVLCEYIENRTVGDLQAIDQESFLDHFGVELTPYRKLCALLPFEALKLILRRINDSQSG